MRGYLSILSARFRTLLQYRAAAVAGLFTQLFWGGIRTMIFTAFYRASTGPQPMSMETAVDYVWLGQAFIMIQPWGLDRDVRDQIRSGAVAYELLRPLDLYALWFSRSVALKTAPTLLRSVPILAIAYLFLGLRPPPTFGAAAAFCVALAAAVAVSAAVSVLLNISMMWTVSGDGAATIVPGFAFILSGMIVPLPLFPDWAQPILNAQPFRFVADVPYRVYLGHLPPDEFGLLFVYALLWILLLVALGRSLMTLSRRRLVVQGG